MSYVERLMLPGTVLALAPRTLELCCTGALLHPVEVDETEVAWILAEAAAAGAPVPAIAAELEREIRGETVRAYRGTVLTIAEGLETPQGQLADGCC